MPFLKIGKFVRFDPREIDKSFEECGGRRPLLCDSREVSFDIFVQAFSDGGAAEADADAVQAVLAPYVDGAAQSGFTRLATTDGGADLYGYDDLGSGFMVNHVSGDEAWDIVVQAAAASGLVVMPVGCPVALTNQDSFEHLPAALRAGEVAIVTSGSQLIDLIQERAWACPVCFEPVLSTRPYETWPPEDLRALQPPYEDSLGRPSHEVCPSCGFEFGNDDNPGTAAPMSFEEYRREALKAANRHLDRSRSEE